MYKYILIVLLIGGTLGWVSPTLSAPTTVPVTFINENPGVTTLGLAKFIMEDGKTTGYKLMNMRWNYKLYVIDLEPGVYGVTQYIPMYDKIVAYQTFEVEMGNPLIVKFRKLL